MENQESISWSRYSSASASFSFFTSFPEELILTLKREIVSDARPDELPDPLLWKSSGDELIFVVEITDLPFTKIYIKAFHKAINQSNQQRKNLPLKACAWLAGFPVCNAELPIAGDNQVSDFIGPLIDIGFRLSKFSSKRKFVLSVDLAWVLLGYDNSFDFHYDGKEKLKGVLRDKSYPVIWIDVRTDDHNPQQWESEPQDIRPPANKSSLKKFCEEFIESAGKPLSKPFAIKRGENIKTERGEEYFNCWKEVKEMLNENLLRLESGEIDSDELKPQVQQNQFMSAVLSKIRQKSGPENSGD